MSTPLSPDRPDPRPRAPAAAAWLRRYAALLEGGDAELAAFLAAAAAPLPRVVWANPLRAAPEATAATLLQLAPGAVPVGWRPHTWRLPPTARPGSWRAHLLGDLYVQEEAALWAGDLVGAQPGERVLDLCAAPGGKSAQLAVAMRDTGLLVANERKAQRVSSLRRTLDRLGVTCAAVTRGDGARLRGLDGRFDRVLADVPCTCEGTTRKSGGRRQEPAPAFRHTVVQVQKALLRAALRMVRPGGVVVYATCTYAPEENEAVLSAVAETDARIEPLTPPPGLLVRPGVTRWQGARFRPDVAHAARIWPHHNDTGGFFVARLRRL